MIIDAIIFIMYIAMITIIIHYYVKKLWLIVKTMKYLKLQRILTEKKLQMEQGEGNEKYNPQDSNENDPMFG